MEEEPVDPAIVAVVRAMVASVSYQAVMSQLHPEVEELERVQKRMWDQEAARAKIAKSMAVPAAAAEEDGGVLHLRSELGLSPKVPNMRLAASPSGLAVPVTPTRDAGRKQRGVNRTRLSTARHSSKGRPVGSQRGLNWASASDDLNAGLPMLSQPALLVSRCLQFCLLAVHYHMGGVAGSAVSGAVCRHGLSQQRRPQQVSLQAATQTLLCWLKRVPKQQ